MIKYGIIGAMELEVATLNDNMKIRNIFKKSNMEYYEGNIGDTEVVVVRSGVGKVNAACCVQILEDEFGVSHVINTGVAGSLNAKLNIGDILVSKDVYHHDVDATIFGYAIGEVPQLGVKGFIADDKLIKLAVDSCKKVSNEIGCATGRVVSGDQFISDSAVKERIINNFHGDCCEMEGAAIAQACYLNNLPFVIIRSISDKADGSDSVDYPVFEKKAAEISAMLVQEMIKNNIDN